MGATVTGGADGIGVGGSDVDVGTSDVIILIVTLKSSIRNLFLRYSFSSSVISFRC